MPGEHRFHNGPLAGQRIPADQMDTRVLDHGVWPLRMGRFQGYYMRDHGSAGGRDWDWEEDLQMHAPPEHNPDLLSGELRFG